MPARHVAIGLAVIALAITAALGGLREAVPRGPTAAGPGTAIDAGPWTITVIKAQLHTDLAPLTLRDPAHHWLAIVAEVEVTATESWPSPGQILRLSDMDGTVAAPPEILLLRGDSTGRAGHLHPGMREQLAFVWEHSGPTAQVTVEVTGLTWRVNPRLGNTSGQQWIPDRSPRARVELPVEGTP